MTKLTLYTRANCPLCEKARADILEIKQDIDFEIEEIDIGASDELTEEFGLMIPVIYIDGEEVGYGIVDEFYLRNRLQQKQRNHIS
jgi:glutaredoxin